MRSSSIRYLNTESYIGFATYNIIALLILVILRVSYVTKGYRTFCFFDLSKKPLPPAQCTEAHIRSRWSWWDSNPRPHKETIRFLHAYSGQCFRASARTGLPTDTLSPKISPAHWGLYRLFPIFLHRLTLRFGTTSLERCLVLSPGDGIKPVIYCTSIRQRERSCFRQLNFCPLRLWR